MTAPREVTPTVAQITLGDELATALFVVAAVAGAAVPGAGGAIVAVISLVLFMIGTITFLWAYAIAIGRSRTEALSVADVFLFTGRALPARDRRRLLGLLGVQVVVAVAAASIQPFTAVAFGILTPMLGLGLCGLAGAKHGTFPPKDDPDAAGDRPSEPTNAPDQPDEPTR